MKTPPWPVKNLLIMISALWSGKVLAWSWVRAGLKNHHKIDIVILV